MAVELTPEQFEAALAYVHHIEKTINNELASYGPDTMLDFRRVEALAARVELVAKIDAYVRARSPHS
jgi:hypothetical protein